MNSLLGCYSSNHNKDAKLRISKKLISTANQKLKFYFKIYKILKLRPFEIVTCTMTEFLHFRCLHVTTKVTNTLRPCFLAGKYL